MSKIKITANGGRYTIIEQRSNPLPEGVTAISSTSLQPWMALNFTAAGAMVGGRTFTEMQREQAISGAKKAGYAIEEQ